MSFMFDSVSCFISCHVSFEFLFTLRFCVHVVSSVIDLFWFVLFFSALGSLNLVRGPEGGPGVSRAKHEKEFKACETRGRERGLQEGGTRTRVDFEK